VHEAFTTHAFGDSSLVVAYAYHPGAKTLFDAHLKPAPATAAPTSGYPRQPPTTTYTYQRGGGVSQHQGQQGQGEQGQPIPERMMWSYIVQLAGAIKRVHDAGQAVRMIDVTKVLVTSKNRCVLFLALQYFVI
jgi:PAB-dependent poly(A)-specific ribonuclease subunit 3